MNHKRSRNITGTNVQEFPPTKHAKRRVVAATPSLLGDAKLFTEVWPAVCILSESSPCCRRLYFGGRNGTATVLM